MTWSELKTLFGVATPESDGFVEKTSGTVPELALYARMVHMEYAGCPHKFSWLLRRYDLTLTGSETYDLLTLIPDLNNIYMIGGSSVPGRNWPYKPVKDYVINGNDYGMTVMGKTLYLSGSPTSGTVTVFYFSNYLVQAQNGTRQKDFTADTDSTVIPEAHSFGLFEGVNRFVMRKEKAPIPTVQTQLWDGRVIQADPFLVRLNAAILDDAPVTKALENLFQK